MRAARAQRMRAVTRTVAYDSRISIVVLVRWQLQLQCSGVGTRVLRTIDTGTITRVLFMDLLSFLTRQICHVESGPALNHLALHVARVRIVHSGRGRSDIMREP